MSTLHLALVQKAATLDPVENRAALDRVRDALRVASPSRDLVILPEAFMCDFGDPDSDLASRSEPLDGPFVAALRDLASTESVTVVAGMFETSEDPTRPYNTVVVVDGTGLRASYRKIHLYDSFGYKESDRLLAGEVEPLVVDVGGFRAGLMTCYDLRFPELARALSAADAELIVVPSAWVAGPGKVDHWRTLAIARAIENTVYVAAVGQPGPRYTGHSLVAGPDGVLVAEVGDGDRILLSSVDHEHLSAVRATNPSLANRRF